ncbi:alpha/beta hydrolase [Microlunatus elymi]|uniref:Alpha/beta hydrolase n=1 Tax=Microlunatus elymi TaxID=2596828 RepID=A0A516PXB3_9ACTN|nr:alpha/beta hydrolase [Microlunatus elymi]QDP95813.1 alpha/beta hydrolase [Microlunatus elymi]
MTEHATNPSHADGPTVVLVHGAWHAPWHWHQVVAGLTGEGVRVETVDLPSCGPDHGDLHDDAAAIRTVLDRQQDALLVAHSYGGIPATEGAAGHPSVRHILYLSAYMADLGESLGGFEPPADESNIHPEVDLAMTEKQLLIMKPERAREVLFHDCPDPDAAIEHLRPMNPAVLGQSPQSVVWKEIPASYVITTDDRATAVSVQRRLSERADQTYEIASGHSSFLAQPDQLCKIINSVAAAL